MPRSRFTQISLRGALLLVSCLAVLLGMLAIYRNSLLHFEADQRELEQRGFDLAHQADKDGWTYFLIGDRYRGHVIKLYGPMAPVNAEQETLIRPILQRVLIRSDELKHLELDHFPFNDDDMKCLSNLTHLQTLNLKKAKITDKGLVFLPLRMPYTSLDLEQTQITDEGINHLAKGHFHHLSLRGTSITDQGLQTLQNTQIYRLTITDTQISPTGLSYLPKIPQLEAIWLGGGEITPEYISQLSGEVNACVFDNREPIETHDAQEWTSTIQQTPSLEDLFEE